MNPTEKKIFEEKLKESRIRYGEFMKQYRLDHEVCPKCGSKDHSSTLVGYVFNSEHPEEYKNLNDCICVNCGDMHTYHERIKKTNNYEK